MVTKKKTSKKVKKISKKKLPVLVSKKNKSKSIKQKKVVKKKSTRFPSEALKEVAHRNKKKKSKKINPKDIATLNLRSEHDIAMDFATKAYKKFNRVIKSIILFGSSIKQTSTADSDIDIIILIDDVSIHWDQKLIAWYRQELDKLLKANPYEKSLHINTVKLSTWWEDLMRGDPIILNILRQGKSLIDLAGFFEPLKYLLIKGKIKSTPEAIYSCLQRAPVHIQRSKSAELNSIEGLYWAMVDSAHAALIAANISPPSPEHIAPELKETFVPGKLKMKYVVWYRDLLILHKDITHGRIHDLKGADIDEWQDRTEEFLGVMARLVNKLVS
ncbi:nucleotidyltransferase domain-containing protein [Candidatus Pacearchaeota archaeon]|nr:nucleotidyltransferase domain-containing protein [Candidatus Pacearchaeota archaeon]